jgi:hypothetical protein
MREPLWDHVLMSCSTPRENDINIPREDVRRGGSSLFSATRSTCLSKSLAKEYHGISFAELLRKT